MRKSIPMPPLTARVALAETAAMTSQFLPYFLAGVAALALSTTLLQEGDHFDAKTQAVVIGELRKELDALGWKNWTRQRSLLSGITRHFDNTPSQV